MKKLFSLLLCLCPLMAVADEGMWTLHDLDPRTVAVMQKLGLEMQATDLYMPGRQGALKDAVVLFGGYCSGVVVSPQGLVFTNHHCGYGSIQKLSSPGEDLLRDGFVARTLDDERRAPGLFVAFLDSVKDVTADVNALKASMSVELACDSVERLYSTLGNYRTLDSYYGGTRFFLSIYRKYDDVRLVFTVPESLGKFGGDTDNWMWPRQTCDFSVFRVYDDGKPLPTPRHARVNLEGQPQGGYCMTVGFPGSTERYLSSYGITSMMNTVNAARAEVRGALLQEWRRHMAADRTVGIKYSSKAASMSNYWKNAIGMNQALRTLGVEQEKRQLEERIDRWIEADTGRLARFGNVTERLRVGYDTLYPSLRASCIMSEAMRGIECFSIAQTRKLLQESKDSTTRARSEERLRQLCKDYDADTDRDATKAVLSYLLANMDSDLLPASLLRAGDCGRFVDSLFQDPQQLNTFREDMLAKQSKIYARLKAMDAISSDEDLLTQALLEMDFERPHYSDANMTMRVSFGTIQPYDNTEGTHYDCFTYPASLLEKANNGNPDYYMQDSLVQLLREARFGRYADKNGDMPLCFLTTNDITGGNSGSPMFDGEGRLLGLAFDGNWDALSSDVKFNTAMTRCIGVDIRYIMFLIECWGKADRLISEIEDGADLRQ